jgi:hypothetical protein
MIVSLLSKLEYPAKARFQGRPMTKIVGGLVFFALLCWTLHIDEQ